MKTVPFMGYPKSICRQHGIIDVLPCPWPDCENGVNGDSFQMQRLFEGDNHKKFYRHEWKSQVGTSYYTWKNEEMPHWFSCSKTLWAEARRLKIVNTKTTEKIYHYTTIDGFLGIVTGQSIWLSDYSYLNDKRELLHGLDIINEVIDCSLAETRSKDEINLLKTWSESSLNSNSRVCIASFSDQPDSLSQWRAYGPIAIGFDLHSLAIHCDQIRIQPVEYKQDNQYKLVQLFINHLLQAYQADLLNNALERIPDVYHRFEQLIELVAFFKNQAFIDEREFRAAYIEHPHLFEDSLFEKPSKKFRTRGNKLLPYVISSEVFPMRNQEKPSLGIREIVLGPETDDLLFRGIREFLDENKMGEIKVIQSNVPYRS